MSIKRNLKAFTLIEILIVIVIIGIIMGMTMGFGGEQIGKLQTKTIEETYLDNLNILQNKMLASNYFEGEKITELTLIIEKGKSVEYTTTKAPTILNDQDTENQDNDRNPDTIPNDSNDIYEIDNHHTVKNIYSAEGDNLTDFDKIYINYRPYHLGCKISSPVDNKEYNEVTFQTKYKNKKTCYSLVGVTCKYKKITCDSTIQ